MFRFVRFPHTTHCIGAQVFGPLGNQGLEALYVIRKERPRGFLIIGPIARQGRKHIIERCSNSPRLLPARMLFHGLFHKPADSG